MNRFVLQGRKAFDKGVVVNPFPDNRKNFERYRDWQFGWNQRYFESPLVEKDHEQKSSDTVE